jgi:predicted ATPase
LQGESDTRWAYELVIRARDKRTSIVERETVTRNEDMLLVRPDSDDAADPERLTQTHLEQVNANKAFRDLTDHFASTQYLHIVPLVIREPKRVVGVNRDAFGSDLLEQIASLPKKTQSSRLAAINRALRSVVPQFSKLELERDANGVPHLKGLFEHWRPQGAWQTEEQFSDGTLRLIGLLWALLAGEGTVLLEEPELSLNAAITRRVPQLFARATRERGRQIFVSTHSADLLMDPGISPDEVLLLAPDNDGTSVRPASGIREIVGLLQAGVPMGEAVMPYTAPAKSHQLDLPF